MAEQSALHLVALSTQGTSVLGHQHNLACSAWQMVL